ncbi:small acid-soluble spore protein O [Paenibacillus sp. HB172176]|uniref:small acid-soluble spore protein O n=1 Tax=Paenibacillus sp. HB172176 TaxID=2493690 RepID=UPI003211DAB4
MKGGIVIRHSRPGFHRSPLHTNHHDSATYELEVYGMAAKSKSGLQSGVSDRQAIKGSQTREFDHEFANEPLTEAEKLNNKKTKKRQ